VSKNWRSYNQWRNAQRLTKALNTLRSFQTPPFSRVVIIHRFWRLWLQWNQLQSTATRPITNILRSRRFCTQGWPSKFRFNRDSSQLWIYWRPIVSSIRANAISHQNMNILKSNKRVSKWSEIYLLVKVAKEINREWFCHHLCHHLKRLHKMCMEVTLTTSILIIFPHFQSARNNCVSWTQVRSRIEVTAGRRHSSESRTRLSSIRSILRLRNLNYQSVTTSPSSTQIKNREFTRRRPTSRRLEITSTSRQA